MTQISKKGDFLNNLRYEWLDKFKSEISSTIIDLFINDANQHAKEYDPSFLIQLADAVFIFDSLDKDALKIKCHSLCKLVKLSLEKKTYDKFTTEFKTSCNESYKLSFSTIRE